MIGAQRLPPQDLDLERGVLASMLLDRAAVSKIVQMGMTDADMYSTAHRTIFKAVLDTFAAGQTPDTLTVSDRLRSMGLLDVAGGTSYLVELVGECRSTPNPEDWVKGLLRLSERRRVISTAATIMQRAFDDTDTDAADESVQLMVEAVEQRRRSRALSIGAALPGFFADLEAAAAGTVRGLKTGYTDLDAMLGGLHGGDFYVLAGRPSMGKTALGLGVALNVAADAHRVLFFSLEMSRKQLMQRCMARRSSLSLHVIRCGLLPTRDFPKLSIAAEPLRDMPLIIDDTPGVTLPYVRAVCNSTKPELVVLDYLQLMNGQVSSRENRTQEIGKISRGLKGLAKELDVPVIALSQLSRACEQRAGDHRPQLSDLREAGDIEQDADAVLFCYRGEYYQPDKAELHGVGEIIVGKQRNGPTGSKTLAWVANTASYENLATDQDGFYNGVD